MLETPASKLFRASLVALALAACGAPETAGPPAEEAPASPQAALRDEMLATIEATMARARSTTGPGSPALWTLSDDDTTVHIFGTVHLLRPETGWRSPAFDAAFAAADRLVIEVDATSPEAQAATVGLMQEYGLLKDGQRLTGLLDEEEEAIVLDAVDAAGLPFTALDLQKPWLVSLQLSLMQIQQAGYDPNAGLEQVLTAEAVAGGKTFGYLETLEEQLGALGGAPIEDQVDGLVLTALTMDQGSRVLDTLVGEWVDGDVEGLGAMIAEPDMIGGEEAYQTLLVNRNRNWVPQIRAMLDEPGTVFVAVGAGHLAGPDSVIAMLRADGLEIAGP